jgi:acyl-CoA synthetase (NDP forming)/RimJ/RimL family protein N-acetyltransferase
VASVRQGREDNRPVPEYPAAWEADVLLRDGHPVHLRPITPADGTALQEFHSRLSAQTVYFRFFTPKPVLTDADVAYFTTVDHRDRVALVAWDRGEIIGVGRFDALGDGTAEVAFIIRDDRQGLGLGSVLLEHLAAAAREVGILRFVAEVLPQNARMLATFREAGFEVRQRHEADVLAVTFAIEPTEQSREVMAAREHRAEARSMERLLRPGCVAVVGASRRPGGLGHAVLQHLTRAGFTGTLVAVHPEVDGIAGVPCVRSLRDARDPVDLAIVVVPAEQVGAVIEDAALAGVHGLVVVSGGFGDAGPDGLERQAQIVATAHRTGMRLVGPNALGLVNTDPRIRLNASLVPNLPRRGRVGFFCQSGALGAATLDRLAAGGLGVSSFVSAGNRADVSGNDLLQYWEEDPDTATVLLHLETIGNARKFARLVRRISRSKPVVMVRTGGAQVLRPRGHDAVPSLLPQQAVDQILADCGLVVVDSVARMIDAGRVLTDRPLPHVPTVAVVGNSDALAVLAANALPDAGLRLAGPPVTFPRGASSEQYAAAVSAAAHDPGVGAVLAVHVPPLEAAGEERVREVLLSCAHCGEETHAPVVAVMTSTRADAEAGGLPVFADVEEAVAALGVAWRVADWRAEDARRREEPEPSWGAPDAAVAASPSLREGEDAVDVVREAVGLALSLEPDPAGEVGCRIRLIDDPSFGAVVCVAVDDPVAAHLQDAAWRLAPVTRRGAEAMVLALGALPVITTDEGTVAALAEVVEALSHVHLQAPGVRSLDTRSVRVVGPGEVTAAQVSVTMGEPMGAAEPGARRL